MRFGLIGTGLMAQEHIRTLNLIPGTEIVALADPEPASLDWARSTLAATVGGERAASIPAYVDVPSLLRETAVDAVIISSPNHTHRAVLEPLLGSGIHILCEKPLATTIADARFLVEAGRRHQGVFWVGMEYRYMPPVARFVADLHAGTVGPIHRLSLHEHRFPFLPKVGDWNRFNRNTGGTMVEKCCHFFDLMRHMLRAEPVRVYCSGAMDVNHKDERYNGETPDIIDNSYTVVDFDNGARAMLDLCMFAEGVEEQEQIAAFGDAGTLQVGIPSGVITHSPRVPWGQEKRVERRAVPVDDAVLAAGHHHGATYYQHLAFLGAIAGTGPVAVSAEDGLKAVAMGTAAEISAREHRAVTLTEVLGR